MTRNISEALADPKSSVHSMTGENIYRRAETPRPPSVWEMGTDALRKEHDRLKGIKDDFYWRMHMGGAGSQASPLGSSDSQRLADISDALGETKGLWRRMPEVLAEAGRMGKATHKKQVEKALARGAPVPSEVLRAHDLTVKEGSAAASEYLNQLGIPGIKYFDGSSRSAGEGTRNFVVFDEATAKITKRNDKPVGGLLSD